ncbi:MAG: VWA domain-containing protein [Planctomycetota bacterium]|nr:VWA domain-containing protein [Planctomycetota bacterium]
MKNSNYHTLVLSSLILATACGSAGRKTDSGGAAVRSGYAGGEEVALGDSSLDRATISGTVSDKAPTTVRRTKSKKSRRKKSRRPRPKPEPVRQVTPSVGLLTAGSWSDIENFQVFAAFSQKLARQNIGAGQSEAMRSIPTRQLIVRLRGKDNQALENVEFRWKYQDGSISRQSYITKTDGSISLCSTWDRLPEAGTVHAMIRAHGEMKNHLVPVTIKESQADLTIKCNELTGKGVKQLDLCLVIDCTGSMGDELRYLQKEISNIAAKVKSRYNNIKVRFSLVVYRDKGDQYVSKRFDFQEDLDNFKDLLDDQQAAGGGDYPEAMDEALNDASILSWNQDQTARVCFLIADAPPHGTRESRVQFALSKLRSQGVVVYPIAGSGVQSQAELIMRHAAFVTGGKYLFLTDDSGVGNSHAEPHIPEYNVERLNYLMTRMIVSELAGEVIPARPGDIVRTVRSKRRSQVNR